MAELADLLAAEKVDEFNLQRGERSRPELFAADLAGKRLGGVDLSGANLEKADLTEADLTEANMMRASLAGIDGTGAKLIDVIGLRARFKGAWMDQADLSGSDFAEADFADAVLESSNGVGVRMARARLRGCDARKVTWPDADLSEAKLHQANFSGADLHSADLTEASGAEADFTDAKLDGIVGIGVKLPGATLVRTSLAAARIPGANLAGADLSGADLSRADLSRANLAGANLTGANLTGAVLADACLDDVDFTDAVLEDADLSGLDPASLGLSDAIAETLSAYGIAWNPDAALVVNKPSIARLGDTVAVVWSNDDGEEQSSLRYALVTRKGLRTGVLPVPAEVALDRQVVAHGDSFVVVITRQRADGPAVVTQTLSRDGKLGPATTVPLGYDPGWHPVLRSADGTLRMWGLARRGPTLVVHELGEEGLVPVRSEKVATARGFLGGHTVLACKGDVLMPVVRTGAGSPRRSPEGFGGRLGVAVPCDGDLVAVWAVRAVGDSPGGLRTATIGRRGAPEVEVLTLVSGVTGLAAIEKGDQVVAVWAEGGEDGLDPTTVFRAVLPEGGPQRIALELPDVVEVALSDEVLALVRADGSAWLGTPEGRELGRIGS